MFDIINSKVSELFRSQAIFITFLSFTVFLCYGYEIFNLNVTIDEEIHSDYVGWVTAWNAQGRWGMGLLSAFVMPSTVVPTVSIFLGVSLTLLAFYSILKEAFRLDEMAAAFTTALAITVPSLSFTFTFSTIAYGIGLGFFVLSISYFLLRSGGWQKISSASVLAGFAIGVYQTFLLVVFLVAGLAAWTRIDQEGRRSIPKSLIEAVSFFLGAIAIYTLVDLLSRKIIGVDLVYVSGFVSFASFFESPWQQLWEGVVQIVKVVDLSTDLFGLTSPWLSVTVVFAFFLVLFSLRKKSIVHRVPIILLISSGWLACAAANAVSVGGAPLRSLIHIPFVIAITVAAGFQRASSTSSILLSTVVLLAVVGNSVISNRLFSSNAYAEKLDESLAVDILREINGLIPNGFENPVLKLEVVGKHSWPESRVMVKKETFGASFLEWDDGNRYRIAAYLRTKGMNVVGASEEERITVWKEGQEMPTWPMPGWMKIQNGILILKLSNYTVTQKKTLCAAGVEDACRQ